MDRLGTGNPQLDSILHGGFPRGSINVVAGSPGSGKTILAQQLAFANARTDRPVLYLSTLSEPLAKLLGYLQQMAFADIELIGSGVIYDSLSEDLKDTPERLPARMLELIQQHRPGVIVIDSFKALADLMPDPQVARRGIFELASLLTAYDTTSFWVGEYCAGAEDGRLEFSIADGIVELSREQTGSRDERFLRIAKLRGSAFRSGSHAFDITGAGIRVYPRLLGPPGDSYELATERLQSGIQGLDEMIEAGWLRGTSTLVAGPSGAGKTMLGLHFLRQGVEDGEPGLLVNFQENHAQLRRVMRSLGWDPENIVRPGRLDVLYSSPIELKIDSIVEELFRRIEEHGVRRIVLDALADLERSAADSRRFRDYMYALTQHFAARGVTAMLALEAEPQDRFSQGNEVEFMSDNIVLLSMELGTELRRTIRITKSRGSAHDGRGHVLQITGGGIVVE